MDRSSLRLCSLPLGFFFAALATGCSIVPTIAYIIKPEDVAAEFDELNGKRVVVICRAASLEYAHPTVGRDLGVRVGELLRKNGKKVQVVDERELADWIDKYEWHDYREVGRAMKADMVVGIDLERFELTQGQTLLQGQADVRLAVYDVPKNLRVWDKRVPTVKFPPNTPVSIQDRQEDDFRRQFIGVLADRVARHFYAYDSRQQVAIDSTALK